ncbi:putative nuclease associated modular domain 3 [Lupinus albus]|uniref:Putative nuclease associated modular domain 3 n=1 Tax=Lupinus albus TaxID=3870 RepID=A0A6A4QNT6_LUPAL|nr:putative nuclease associated modular domain 3 [Lupinus albus]
MPLFDIANAQFFQYHLCSLRARTPCNGKLQSVSFTFGNEYSVACAWKSLDKHEKVKLNLGGVDLGRSRSMIKAIVTTLEPKSLIAKEDECFGSKDLELALSPNSQEVLLESSSEELEEPDEKERLRRMKISKANKGQTAWNKGRKHSAETLRKIKERTKLAMQNPKIKMKLAKFRHPQTIETKQKIGAAVKMRSKRKRKRKVVQETCCFEWQNLIAEASRRGYVHQEELQWNSYEILNEQMEQEWLVSVKEGKHIPRSSGRSRAPKTPEHRRKIAEAIAAKWADPEYANKVISAKTKLHGTERKPRRPSGAQSTRSNRIVKTNANTNINVKSDTDVLNQIKLEKRNSPPTYKDPLASSKLDMIKTARVQRAAADAELIKAIEQARLLIAEAEKAATALEFAATKSPIAQASLIESRQLIAEAIQSLESIHTHVPSVASSEVNKENDAEFVNQSQKDPVNGHRTLSPSDYKFSNDLGKFSSRKLVNGDSELHPTSIDGCASFPVGYNGNIEESSSSNQQRETEQDQSSEYKTDRSRILREIPSIKDETPPRPPIVTKKWVCGRLVEVVKQ